MLNNVLKIIAIFIFGMGGGIFADQIFWPYFVERPLFYQYNLEQRPIYVTERREIVIRENTALQDAVDKVSQAVVAVKAESARGKVFHGSGLIVTSDGLMVTLAELVPPGGVFTFLVGGQSVPYQILRRDAENNLALVRLEGTTFTTVGFADFLKLRPGERVFLVGSGVVNQGIVKSFDENLIQTNISEETRLAGSPLFNIEGNLLGLNNLDKEGRIVALPVIKLRSFLGL